MGSNISNNSRRQEMFKIVEEYRQSGQTQKEFCQQRGLSLFQFKYWLQKYRKEESRDNAFIRLKPGNANSLGSYRIDLPNGIIIHLNGSESLKLISEIIGHVSGK